MAWSVGHPGGHSRRLGWGPVNWRARRGKDHASGCGEGSDEGTPPRVYRRVIWSTTRARVRQDVWGSLGYLAHVWLRPQRTAPAARSRKPTQKSGRSRTRGTLARGGARIAPKPHRLAIDLNPAFGQRIPDVTQRRWLADVQITARRMMSGGVLTQRKGPGLPIPET